MLLSIIITKGKCLFLTIVQISQQILQQWLADTQRLETSLNLSATERNAIEATVL
jgi:hypothetical protein